MPKTKQTKEQTPSKRKFVDLLVRSQSSSLEFAIPSWLEKRHILSFIEGITVDRDEEDIDIVNA